MAARFKIFLDTSALLSGLNSPLGGAGIILNLFKEGELEIIVSEFVLEETRRALQEKFFKLQKPFEDFLNLKPKILPDPTIEEVKKAAKIIDKKDAPILAAALSVNPDFLVTLDRQHFLTPEVIRFTPFAIGTPGDFLAGLRI
ncbi:putative toxin-antitoxin system toxin component, PIN family [Candidatus Berkelbacteria bacterium]|nr:putative toxin-antitoxin system toxin component, PIN family [Candidatus Berkelbacteria bacterium]MBI2588165.1 putative toxin-antitoxin system toxin component, PIN family [Candidatus Berkelbacteria bacterium]MBI4029732.1 putative toxin-antitoxin system toxin component, PIN family [Candidatus Berkelbacteria bacterium]